MYEDETLIWSPKNNPSIVNLDRSKELFAASAVTHMITSLYTTKEEGGNILTL